MKKLVILIMLLLTLGCEKEQNKLDFLDDFQEIHQNVENELSDLKNIYVDTNPIQVGLYYKGKLVKDYNFKFKDRTDIATFNIVYTQKDNLGSTSVKDNWNTYYKKYENIDDYKIGFLIQIEANGKKIENTVLNPDDIYNLNPYLHTYLYDGVHAKGRYTHLTKEDMKDNTVFSSIKLYLHLQTNELTGPIYLTVFTYKDENDFINGQYRGNSKYTITINNK